jgi:hypothetical protein
VYAEADGEELEVESVHVPQSAPRTVVVMPATSPVAPMAFVEDAYILEEFIRGGPASSPAQAHDVIVEPVAEDVAFEPTVALVDVNNSVVSKLLNESVASVAISPAPVKMEGASPAGEPSPAAVVAFVEEVAAVAVPAPVPVQLDFQEGAIIEEAPVSAVLQDVPLAAVPEPVAVEAVPAEVVEESAAIPATVVPQECPATVTLTASPARSEAPTPIAVEACVAESPVVIAPTPVAALTPAVTQPSPKPASVDELSHRYTVAARPIEPAMLPFMPRTLPRTRVQHLVQQPAVASRTSPAADFLGALVVVVLLLVLVLVVMSRGATNHPASLLGMCLSDSGDWICGGEPYYS